MNYSRSRRRRRSRWTDCESASDTADTPEEVTFVRTSSGLVLCFFGKSHLKKKGFEHASRRNSSAAQKCKASRSPKESKKWKNSNAAAAREDRMWSHRPHRPTDRLTLVKRRTQENTHTRTHNSPLSDFVSFVCVCLLAGCHFFFFDFFDRILYVRVLE